MIRDGIRRALNLALRRRDRWEREVEDEIKLHLMLRAEQLAAQGLSPEDAYNEAVRRFGPLDQSRARLLDSARHREQSMQRTEYLADLRQDIAFAFRTLARQRVWTAVTIATFALGIGATTAVFSVVSTLLLHPLPYPAARRIVYVDQQPSEGNNTGMSISINPGAEVVRAWKQGAGSFEAIEGFKGGALSMATTSDPSTVRAAYVFPTFASFAGQRPIIGRMFTDADIIERNHVVLLGESLWRTRFAADAAVLGKSIRLSDSSYTIIGVLPAALKHPNLSALPRDVWLPLDVRDDKQGMSVIARLKRGASADVAARELDSLFARASAIEGKKLPFQARILTPGQTVSFHDSLVMLVVAVGFVLLVACANVAHLLMARSATRQRELAVRAALGAGRGRLFRQLLTESLILSLAGAVAGVFVGWLGLRGLIALRPNRLAELSAAHLDLYTLGVAVGVAVLSGVFFGVIGATQSSHSSTHDALKSGVANAARAGVRGRGRGLLVVSEMALSAALVVSATMLVRSVIKLQRADLGFTPTGLYSIDLNLPEKRYSSAAAKAAFVNELLARAQRVPGVRETSLAAAGPGARNFAVGRLEIEGEPPPPATSSSFIDVNNVRGDYFKTMGMRLVEGSTITDTSAAAGQVVINAGFARKHWAGSSALGHRLRIARSANEPWLTIVGVVGDASISGPTSESSAPFLYTPLRYGQVAVLIRTGGDATPMQAIRAAAKSLDPALSPTVSSAEEMVSRSLAAPRFVMLLLTTFTGLALALAAVGMYGVMAYTVAQQTREIGIRLALGAPSARIARSVLVRGAVLALIGSVIGLGGAAWGTKLIENQLYGVTRSDPASFIAAVVVLVGAAVLACALPTRRALSVDPVTAIRAD